MPITLMTDLSKHSISELARGLRDLLAETGSRDEEPDDADIERVFEIIDMIELKASRSEAASRKDLQ